MVESKPVAAVYGSAPPGLVEAPTGAVQVSPLSPGADALERIEPHSLREMVMTAPPGAMERRYQLALALRASRPGARMTVLAPRDKGGARLRKELEAFGCVVQERAKHHFRICACVRPEAVSGVAEATEGGAPRVVAGLSMWSQPGVFSWDRIDPGSALLVRILPALGGMGADLGCGIGYLARAVLACPQVRGLELVDIDRRAIEAARRNIDDPRAAFRWADVTAAEAGSGGADGAPLPGGLDFVVTNPPFHQEGVERRELGRAFIRHAAQRLRRGGVLWLVANRHLPYEAELAALFGRVEVKAERDGYKVFEALR